MKSILTNFKKICPLQHNYLSVASFPFSLIYTGLNNLYLKNILSKFQIAWANATLIIKCDVMLNVTLLRHSSNITALRLGVSAAHSLSIVKSVT